MNHTHMKTHSLQLSMSMVAALISLIVLPACSHQRGEQSTSEQQQLSQTTVEKQEAPLKLTQEWDKTFPKSDKVTHRKVTFPNRYGITLAADLYMPKEKSAELLPALVVSGPFGAVKEQASGLYAQTMAEKGFVTIAVDPSYTGESGGEPRNLASPEINTDDVSAMVDFVGTLPEVDRERIGAIGICGFGGMTLNAAAVDKRIKAVVTTSMYDMSRVMAKGYYDKMTPEQRSESLAQMSEQRWKDIESGSPASGSRNLPKELDEDADPVTSMYFDYYRTPRGFHERSVNSNGAWNTTNPLSFMNMPLLTYIDEISPRPILLIAGDNAHSRYFSEDAYKDAAEPKELLIIEDAVHTDLYDKLDKIPFEKIESFFNTNLNK